MGAIPHRALGVIRPDPVEWIRLHASRGSDEGGDLWQEGLSGIDRHQHRVESVVVDEALRGLTGETRGHRQDWDVETAEQGGQSGKPRPDSRHSRARRPGSRSSESCGGVAVIIGVNTEIGQVPAGKLLMFCETAISFHKEYPPLRIASATPIAPERP